MFGGVFIGVMLDLPCFSRSQRAKLGWGIIFSLTFIIWGGGYAFQKWSDTIHKVGWLDFSEAGLCELIIHGYICYAHKNVKSLALASCISSTGFMMLASKASVIGQWVP